MPEQKPKMNLTRDNKDLKLYMFTIQKGPVHFNFPEDFQAIMAYDDSDALEKIRSQHNQSDAFIKQRARLDIKKIIDVINLEVTPLEAPVVTPVQPDPLPPTPEKTAQDFICGIMLVADQFVKNKKDRKILKEIIGKIKNDEDKPNFQPPQNLT